MPRCAHRLISLLACAARRQAVAYFYCSIIATSLFGVSCSRHSYLDAMGNPLPLLNTEQETQQQADLLYAILAAEFAHQAGEWQLAADSYAQAAKGTDELPILERALLVLLQANDYEKAADVGSKILAYPTQQNFKVAMVALYLQTEQVPKAAAMTQQLLAEDMPPARLFGYLYQAYMDISKLSGAYATIEQFGRHFPAQAEAQTFVATVAFHLADFEQTVVAIDRILHVRDNDPSAYFLKARLMLSNGRVDEGFYYWRQALREQPDNVEQRVDYAQTLSEYQHFKHAYDEFLYLHFQYPDHPEYMKALGQLALKQKHYDQAEQWFSLLSQNPDRFNQSLYFMGRVLEERRDYEEALSLYEQVPTDDNVLYRQAQLGIVRVHQQQGDLDTALAYIEKARKNASNYTLKVDFYLLQGEVLRNAGLIQREWNLYTEAINNYIDADSLLYARALAASRLNLVHRVEQDIRRILARNPDHPHALNVLGYELTKRNIRLQEAKQYIVRAHRLAPHDPAILDSMGWIEFRLKNYDLAEGYIRRAMLVLYEAEIIGHLVEVMRAQTRFQEAEQLLHKALDDFPNDEYLNLLLESQQQ